MRILLVEDNPDLRNVVADCLTQEQHEVVKASNGDAGLSILQHSSFDLIILDFIMPIMDGIEFLRLKRLLPVLQSIPVLVLTGVLGVDDDFKQNPCVVMVLHKPFDRPDLLRAVNNCVEKEASP